MLYVAENDTAGKPRLGRTGDQADNLDRADNGDRRADNGDRAENALTFTYVALHLFGNTFEHFSSAF